MLPIYSKLTVLGFTLTSNGIAWVLLATESSSLEDYWQFEFQHFEICKNLFLEEPFFTSLGRLRQPMHLQYFQLCLA